MASRLASILEQEYKTKGVFSGAISALGKQSREKMDIRNVLFGGSGLGSIIGRKIFGKGYSAVGGSKDGASLDSSSSFSGSSPLLERIITNTSYMPNMARDMNVIKQNVIKLVSSKKIKPATSATNFFAGAAARESAYESKFQKKDSKTEKSQDKGNGGILAGILSIVGGVATVISSIIGMVGKASKGLFGLISGALGVALSAFSGKFKKLFKILGLGALVSSPFMFSDDVNAQIPGELSGDVTEKSSAFSNFGTEATVAAGGLATAKAYDAIKGKFSTPTPATAPVVETTPTKTYTGSNERVARSAARNAGVNSAEKAVKEISDILTKSKSKGWLGELAKTVLKKFPGRIALFILGLVGAGATGPFAIAVAAAEFVMWGILAWDVYHFIVDWFELKEKQPTIEQVLTMDFDEEGNITKTYMAPKNPQSPTPASGPTPTTGSPAIGGGRTFNDMSREEQDIFLKNQAIAEGSNKPGTVGYRHNNPGNIVAKSPTEVYPAQAKFGGVPGETITGPDGKTRTFVRFPDWESGVAAQRDLWQRKYGNQPIETALNKWVDPSTSTEMANYQKNMGGTGGKTVLASTGSKTELAGSKQKDFGSKLDDLNARAIAANKPKTGDTNVQVVTAPQAPAQQSGNQQVAAASAFDSELSKFLLTPMVL